MSVKSVIEKLQWITREKEVQKSEHKRRQEEEVELLWRTKVGEELRKAKRRMLNI
jgi:hypothetical protein